jgi:3-methylcrotonyl-CoA carboxylase alpha subunit
VALLKRLVDSEPFTGAELDTGLIEWHCYALFPPARSVDASVLALAAVRLLGDEQGRVSADPWSHTQGWRLNGMLARTLVFGADAG